MTNVWPELFELMLTLILNMARKSVEPWIIMIFSGEDKSLLKYSEAFVND